MEIGRVAIGPALSGDYAFGVNSGQRQNFEGTSIGGTTSMGPVALHAQGQFNANGGIEGGGGGGIGLGAGYALTSVETSSFTVRDLGELVGNLWDTFASSTKVKGRRCP